jgi:hypothetical protein
MKKTFTLIRCLALLLGLTWQTQSLQASHAVGNDITWACNPNNPCELIFTFTFYRQCQGATYATPPPLNFRGCGVSISSSAWTGGLLGEITPLCPGEVSNCNGGTVLGVEQYRHTLTYNTCVNNPGCQSMTADWTLCCRNAGITSLVGSPQMSTTSTIAINQTPCNSSPVFNSIPVLFLCNGQSNTFSQGATDPDGNTLQYSLLPCMQGPGTSVPYAAGFSPTTPLGAGWNVALNPSNGNITFTPTPGGILTGVICVQVNELNGAGVVIGTVVRDIQVRILNCANNLPTLSGPYSYQSCLGEQFCVNIASADLDLANNLTVSVINNTTGAPIFISGGSRPTASMCFIPTSLGTYTFTLEVRDNACPLVGVQQFTYSIEVVSCNPCDRLEIKPDIKLTEGNLSLEVTNTSTLNPYGPVFTHITWGDGTSSSYPGNYQDPVFHNYQSPGTYIVCVIIEAIIGTECCKDSICKEVKIEGEPCSNHKARYTWYAEAAPKCTYTFTDISTPASDMVYWDFGDGSPLGFGSPITHTFPNGTFVVTMTSMYHAGKDPEVCCTDTYRQRYRFNCDIGIDPDPIDISLSRVHQNSLSGFLDVYLGDLVRGTAPTKVQILDVSGKQLKEVEFKGEGVHFMSIADLPDGIYLARFLGNFNSETTKFIKQ